MQSFVCLLGNQIQSKFFKKNPHCTSVMCDNPSRLKAAKLNKYHNAFGYSKNNPKHIDESNLPFISFQDIFINGNVFETIDQVKEVNVDRIKYQSRAQRPTTQQHMGQLKLFLSTFQFLTKYALKDERTNVIYPGSSPGHNIPLLIKLFPNVVWHLYDPRSFDKRLYNNPSVETIVVDFFLDKHIEELKDKLKGQRILLISDIRVVTNETEESVERDMRLQEDWVKKLKPSYAQLKFRIPRIDPYLSSEGVIASTYSYLKGNLYLQLFARECTTETRLVVSSSDEFIDDDYDIEDYEGDCYFFNRRLRVCVYNKQSKNKLLDRCHDCASMISMVEDYLEVYDNPMLKEKLIDMILRISGVSQSLAKGRDEILKNIKM